MRVRLRAVATIRPFGAWRILSGVPVGSATMQFRACTGIVSAIETTPTAKAVRYILVLQFGGIPHALAEYYQRSCLGETGIRRGFQELGPGTWNSHPLTRLSG